MALLVAAEGLQQLAGPSLDLCHGHDHGLSLDLSLFLDLSDLQAELAAGQGLLPHVACLDLWVLAEELAGLGVVGLAAASG